VATRSIAGEVHVAPLPHDIDGAEVDVGHRRHRPSGDHPGGLPGEKRQDEIDVRDIGVLAAVQERRAIGELLMRLIVDAESAERRADAGALARIGYRYLVDLVARELRAVG